MADTFIPRKHQRQLIEVLRAISAGQRVTILAHVVPGGGKSLLPKYIAERFPEYRIAWFVPRLSLRNQGARDLMKHGIEIMETTGETNPSRGTRGFIATHDTLINYANEFEQEFKRHSYVLIIDEVHHAKVKRDGQAMPLARAIQQLSSYVIRLDMTGTLETNDNTLIEGIEYEEQVEHGSIERARTYLVPQPEKSADHFIRYDRSDALREKAIVPIEFYRHDGTVQFARNGIVEDEVSLSSAAKGDEGAALFTALRTPYAHRLLTTGVKHWRQHGQKLLSSQPRRMMQGDTVRRYLL